MALNNVPQAGQTLAVTRNPIQQNFSVIDTAFSVNHVAYGAGGQGKHNFVSLPVQGAAPATIAGEIALFSQTSAVTGNPELALRRQTNGTSYEISTYGTGSYSFNSGGQGSITYTYTWTRLPSGLLMLWGTQTSVGPAFTATGLVMVFPTATSFPGFATAVYNVGVTLQWNDNTGSNSDQPLVLVQGATTTAQFRFTRESQNQYATKGSISFTAIGI